jgi:urease accessory protein
MAWLPQETIIFNLARFHRETEIEISSGAELLALEWLVFGRTAHGEQLLGGQLIDKWRVKSDGRLIWAESFRVGEEGFRHLNRRATLSNCTAIATLIYFGTELDRRLSLLRDIAAALKCCCAATLVGGLMIIRLAADASSNLKLALCSLLQQLGPTLGRGPFRVPKMWSSC